MPKIIEAKMGEIFYPFSSLRGLRKAETPDCFGYSHQFSLEGVGTGHAILLKIEGLDQLDGRLLISALSNECLYTLRNSLGWLSVGFSGLDNQLSRQPKMWCVVEYNSRRFIAPNKNYYDDPDNILDGPIFSKFRPEGQTHRNFLFVTPDPRALGNLGIGFTDKPLRVRSKNYF